MDSTLEVYFRNIKNRTRLLTREEEIELAKKIEAGDMRAKNKMIESNLPSNINCKKICSIWFQFGRFNSGK